MNPAMYFSVRAGFEFSGYLMENLLSVHVRGEKIKFKNGLWASSKCQNVYVL